MAIAAFADAGAAEDDDGGANAPLAQRHLRLGVFEQKTHAAHGIAEQEVLVERGKTIGGGFHLRGIGLGIGHGTIIY
jgi:hypothetical protein